MCLDLQAAPASKVQTNGTTRQSPAPSPVQPSSTARPSTPTAPAETKPAVRRPSTSSNTESKSTASRPRGTVYYDSGKEEPVAKKTDASPNKSSGLSALPSRPGPPSYLPLLHTRIELTALLQSTTI